LSEAIVLSLQQNVCLPAKQFVDLWIGWSRNSLNLLVALYTIFTMNTKKLCILGATIVSLAFAPISIHACQLSSSHNKILSNMKFRFEDYEKAQDAEKKMLELFPIGSKYSTLVDELQAFPGMGCTKSQYSPSMECQYFVRISSIASYSWSILIAEKNGQISELNVYKTISAL
jgi:hypothetical protein